MAERLQSRQWSTDTLLRGVQHVAGQPGGELLPDRDADLLSELQVWLEIYSQQHTTT